MRHAPSRLGWLFSPVPVLTAVLLTATPAAGGALGDPDAPNGRAVQSVGQALGTPDFLFGRPRGWVAIRGSWLVPSAGGDLFAFLRDQLTVERRDFSTPAMMGELGLSITPRINASAGLEFSRQTVQSEYRHFVDNRGLPINQRTMLAQTNISGSLKVAVLDRGRSISRLAFVPRTVAPYVGAGAGILFYQLRQTGDFVDFVSLRVFPDVFRSQAWTPSAHVFGGTDVRLWRALFLDLEGRYVWAHGDLDSDFVGFDGIDLDGFRFSTGVSVVF